VVLNFAIPASPQRVYYYTKGRVKVEHTKEFEDYCSESMRVSPYTTDPRCGNDPRLGDFDGRGIPNYYAELLVTPYGTNVSEQGVILSTGGTVSGTGDSIQVGTATGRDAGIVTIVRVKRSGIGAQTTPGVKGVGTVQVYKVSGYQRFVVEALGPVTAIPSSSIALTNKDTIDFVADAGGSAVTNASWMWWNSDTLSTPGTGASQWAVPQCAGQTTCRYAPPFSGRMYVIAANVNGIHWTGMSAGPVVWVGKKKLTLSCVPGSTVVGGSVTCMTGTIPGGGTITTPIWSYSGGVSPPPGSSTSWTFTATSVGTIIVTVSAIVDGNPTRQTATDTVTVDCNMFGGATGDTILDNPAVQQALSSLWSNSDPHNSDLFKRHEQGGWVVRHGAGTLSVEPFASNTSPGTCTAYAASAERAAIDSRTNGDKVIGALHTHPHTPPIQRNVVATSACGSYAVGDIITFKPGLSGIIGGKSGDMAVAGSQNIPVYALDHENALRGSPSGAKASFRRDQSCNY
jgi:hypothetical protein